MGGLIRYRRVQIKPTEHHEVQTHLKRTLKLGVAHIVPLADQQAVEQDLWIVALRANTGSPKTTFENR